MCRLTLFGALLLALGLVAGDTHHALGAESCPDGTFVFVASGECFPVVDMTGSLGLTGTTPPDSVVYSQSGSGGAQADETIPEPQGNVWAGTTYERYHLDASEGAVLQTSVIVYPNGLGTDLSPNWIFTAATNRTDYFVEVFVAYSGADTVDLIVYDTSCFRAPAYPCEDPTSSIQVNVPLSDIPCYQSMEQDESGDWNRFLTYNNFGVKIDNESPPEWWNTVQLFNYCTETWDNVYSHFFRADQADCAEENCAWWGPIIETLPREWYPYTLSVPELGYRNSAILLWTPSSEDGLLEPGPTKFSHPGGSAWQTFDLEPNHTYGVGGFKDGDGDGYADTTQLEQRASEEFLGTDPADDCADTTTRLDERGPQYGEPLSPWPPDLDDSGHVDFGDIALFANHWLAQTGDPNYWARFDLNGDGSVDMGDVMSTAPFFNTSCAP